MNQILKYDKFIKYNKNSFNIYIQESIFPESIILLDKIDNNETMEVIETVFIFELIAQNIDQNNLAIQKQIIKNRSLKWCQTVIEFLSYMHIKNIIDNTIDIYKFYLNHS